MTKVKAVIEKLIIAPELFSAAVSYILKYFTLANNYIYFRQLKRDEKLVHSRKVP